MGDFNAYDHYRSGKSSSLDQYSDIYGTIDRSKLEATQTKGDFDFERSENRSVQTDGRNHTPAKRTSRRHSAHINSRVSGITGEHLIDIVCIAITVIALVLITINFEAVMLWLINLIYPAIEFVMVIAAVLILIGVLVVALRSSIRRRWF